MSCKNCFQQLHTMKDGCSECGDKWKNHVYIDEISEFTKDNFDKAADRHKRKITTSKGMNRFERFILMFSFGYILADITHRIFM